MTSDSGSARILWVDDDNDLLLLVRRLLRDVVQLDACGSGEEAVLAMSRGPEYAVIVSDMVMPGMDGVRLLARVKERWPETVRMMFTGLDDQATAVQAMNDGRVFRFLNKGAAPEDIIDAIHAALQEHASQRAERAVLESTLVGAVRALIDVLALTQPSAFGRGARIRMVTRDLCRELGWNGWEVELAATVSQLGCVILPQSTMQRIAEGKAISLEQQQLYSTHPQIGSDLIGKIPRLQTVAAIVRYQHKRFDGKGFPSDALAGDDIPFGARVLKVVLDFDRLQTVGMGADSALVRMQTREGWYDPAILAALARVGGRWTLDQTRTVLAADLEGGMILAADIEGEDGALMAMRGQEVTVALARRIRSSVEARSIADGFLVYVGEIQPGIWCEGGRR